jgi:hypothetical protein
MGLAMTRGANCGSINTTSTPCVEEEPMAPMTGGLPKRIARAVLGSLTLNRIIS